MKKQKNTRKLPMCFWLACFTLIIYIAASACAAQAKRVIFRFHGQASGDRFGYSVSSAGDVNGDGVPDFIVGAPEARPAGHVSAGSAYVYSGGNGKLLFRFDGKDQGFALGSSVSNAGDVNRDGIPDFIVGAPAAGYAYVFSGANGRKLFELGKGEDYSMFGHSVSSAGDVNGDGVPDLIVGAPAVGELSTGRVYVFSGINGKLLFRLGAKCSLPYFGWSDAPVGDVNGDGVPDLIVGAPNLARSRCRVYLFSGKNRKALLSFRGPGRFDQMGLSMSIAGDVIEDGVPDVIVGASGTDTKGNADAGSAHLFSGSDGNLLFRFTGEEASEELGKSISTAGDVNGDGVPDVIVGAPFAGRFGLPAGLFPFGRVNVFSGTDGKELFRFNGRASGDLFGWSVSNAGDVDKDGSPDFLVGAPGTNIRGVGQNAGSVLVLSSH